MLVREMIRNVNFLKLQKGLSKLIRISVNSVRNANRLLAVIDENKLSKETFEQGICMG